MKLHDPHNIYIYIYIYIYFFFFFQLLLFESEKQVWLTI